MSATAPTAAALPSGVATPASLGANFSWLLAGRVAYLAGQWGVLVAIARLGSVELMGRYGLALAVCAPVFALLDARLASVLATGRDSDAPPSTYLLLRLITAASGVGLCWLASSWAYGAGSPITLLVVVVAAAKAVESISALVHGLLQKREWMAPVGQSLIGVNAIMVSGVAVAIAWGGTIVWVAAAIVVARLIALVLFDLPGARRAGLSADGWDGAAQRRLAWLVAPLAVMTALKSLATMVPRYALDAEFGAAELGYFTATAAFLLGATTVSTSLAQAAAPRLALRLNGAGFGRLLLKLVAVGAGLGLLGVFVAAIAGDLLLAGFFGAGYASQQPVLVWLMVAAMALHVRGFLGAALTAMRVMHAQALVALLTLAAAIVGALVLVPDNGSLGAAWAIALAAWVSAASAAGVLAWSRHRREVTS